MPTPRIAIVSEVPALTFAEMQAVAAALHNQVSLHFGPIWGVEAEVIAVEPGQPAPTGAWSVTVLEHFDAHGMAGLHYDENDNPWAKIEYSANWSLAASHELLEMLTDPLADRIIDGPCPSDPTREVHILVEVCDPCQEATHAYAIDGVTVSDFLTPAYYRADSPAGTACSFKGSVSAPFGLLEGGYMTWQDPTSLALWQAYWPLGEQQAGYRQLGTLPNDLAGEQPKLRQWVDRETLRQGMPGSPHHH